jgi:hypothetical protein
MGLEPILRIENGKQTATLMLILYFLLSIALPVAPQRAPIARSNTHPRNAMFLGFFISNVV